MAVVGLGLVTRVVRLLAVFMEQISRWEFDTYALSLPRGHGFGERPPIGAWRSADKLSCGILTQDVKDKSFGTLVLRRRIDHVWTVIAECYGLASAEDALTEMNRRQRNGEPLEPVPSGVAIRPVLHDLRGRTASDIFNVLNHATHHPAAWTLNQLYLALPNPDRNWASDCQTANFHTRIWEAQLLAAFREQGLLVSQPFDAPDFRIEDRHGGMAWVEAVTANPPVAYNHFNAPRSIAPTEPMEAFFGPAALRFAKTLGNKLARRYDQLPHVTGLPFMLAVADFQAPSSMIWSREGLIGYLYSEGAQKIEVDSRTRAQVMPSPHLLADASFATGLFADDRHPELSAVIFSNACSIAKLNRVAMSGDYSSEHFRYFRIGQFFDRTPGAPQGIPFCMDVTSEEYRRLWPMGYEPWCAEVEVFHNPFARHPVPFELLPEVTHWFVEDGERICCSHYATSILWSQTRIQGVTMPPLRLEDMITASETPDAQE